MQDGSGTLHKACVKKKGIMFDPEFMKCLQAFGRSKASRAKPWLTIGELEIEGLNIQQAMIVLWSVRVHIAIMEIILSPQFLRVAEAGASELVRGGSL